MEEESRLVNRLACDWRIRIQFSVTQSIVESAPFFEGRLLDFAVVGSYWIVVISKLRAVNMIVVLMIERSSFNHYVQLKGFCNNVPACSALSAQLLLSSSYCNRHSHQVLLLVPPPHMTGAEERLVWGIPTIRTDSDLKLPKHGMCQFLRPNHRQSL